MKATNSRPRKYKTVFNTQDICTAYYHYSQTLPVSKDLHYDWLEVFSYKVRIGYQMYDLQFQPIFHNLDLRYISRNAKLIYLNLIDRHIGKTSTKENYPKMLEAKRLVNLYG